MCVCVHEWLNDSSSDGHGSGARLQDGRISRGVHLQGPSGVSREPIRPQPLHTRSGENDVRALTELIPYALLVVDCLYLSALVMSSSFLMIDCFCVLLLLDSFIFSLVVREIAATKQLGHLCRNML